MPFDLASALGEHFDFFHNPEEVTYTSVLTQSDTGNVIAEEQPAVRRALSKRDVAFYGDVITQTDATIFHLKNPINGMTEGVEADPEADPPVEEVLPEAATIVPKQGDKITDSDGTIWTVQSTEKQTLGTRWRCLVTRDR